MVPIKSDEGLVGNLDQRDPEMTKPRNLLDCQTEIDPITNYNLNLD